MSFVNREWKQKYPQKIKWQKRYDINNILDYVLNDDTDEECIESDVDGESESYDIDYKSDVEVQPTFA